ncbi:Wzy polymerase domain-containing protein [Ramlibacter sp. 2FC]|uniref:PglL family O-oligosaccharyltransferase n=1 Tax=Ramlibacter sp. 2FC TaxID=2502188 RepID=UPI0014852568|nr:Wzy polymerase domain-containing protein [Ramlibacter sp. 2FC]
MTRTISAWSTTGLLLALWLWPFAGGPSPAVQPMLFGLLVAALLWFLAAPQGRVLSGLVLALSALAAASALTAPLVWAGTLVGGLMVCAGYAATQAGEQGRGAHLLAWAWLLAGLLSSFMGLMQYAGVGAALAPWINATEVGQAFANLRQRNQFASLTNIGLVAGLYLAASPAQRKQAVLLTLGAALLAAGNAASGSRTGLVQLAVVLVLAGGWGALRRPLQRRMLVVAVLAYGAASMALPWLAGLGALPPGALARLASEQVDCASRLTLWRNVLQLIALRPWLGWGWGELDYAHFVTLYEGPRFCDILDNAHNLPLHLAVELGLPAAMALCGAVVWAVWRARPWRETDAARRMAWGVLAVIALHSGLEYPLWYGPFQIALGLCLGLLWPNAATRSASHMTSTKPLASWPQKLLALALIAASGAAAWDYWRVSQVYLPPEARAEAWRDDPLAAVRGSWLFRDQARFAELTLSALSRENAVWTYRTASALLHYAPEPRVVEALVESAVLLGREQEALALLVRYRAAFPEAHAHWARRQTGAGG